jgi:hypothetical protein
MNKSQGVTATAFVLVGALLRPVAMQNPSPSNSDGSIAAGPSVTSLSETKGVGPWVASCQYWAPARLAIPKGESEGQISINLRSNHAQLDAHVTADEAKDQSCLGTADPWGIPDASGPLQPNITSIIAVVPDPLHAHVSLDFDRTIDSLLQAAADNGYVESYSWLPWRSPEQTSTRGEKTQEQGKEENRARERQPGLVVLKHVSGPVDPPYPHYSDTIWSNYNRVIYLFLVGSTPVLGVNGEQLENALRCEKDLQTRRDSHKFAFSLSTKTPNPDDLNELSIIGPDTSGSAASLRTGLETAAAKLNLQFKNVLIAGETSTALASEILNFPITSRGGAIPVQYFSFGYDSNFNEKHVLESVRDSGHDLGRVAYLIEDATTFGRIRVGLREISGSSIIIRFPRGISLLRNAHREDDPGQSDNEPSSPYLHLSLQDSSVEDTVSHFSQQHTPLSPFPGNSNDTEFNTFLLVLQTFSTRSFWLNFYTQLFQTREYSQREVQTSFMSVRLITYLL